jgi:hypothetical protein
MWWDLRSSRILRSAGCSQVPTFRDNLSVALSRVKQSKKNAGTVGRTFL